jgi:hypothetical protein
VRGNDEARVALTPIATPLPLTFVGLMVALLVLSGLEAGSPVRRHGDHRVTQLENEAGVRKNL